MDRVTFEREMNKARTLERIDDRPTYWRGYQCGLERRFYGKKIGTDGKHALWIDLMKNTDSAQTEWVKGYREGYMPVYCTQNNGECHTCSLVNNGKDCWNNPIN